MPSRKPSDTANSGPNREKTDWLNMNVSSLLNLSLLKSSSVPFAQCRFGKWFSDSERHSSTTAFWRIEFRSTDIDVPGASAAMYETRSLGS